jgi:hypothetical protein
MAPPGFRPFNANIASYLLGHVLEPVDFFAMLHDVAIFSSKETPFASS